MDEKLKAIQQMLSSTMEEKGIPGLSIALVSKGELLYAEGFGKLHASSHEDVTPETVFSIMSITKSFTSTALVHLQENSDFDLNQPIKEYLPYFRTKDGQEDKITTKHILSHTAGFPEDLWVVTLLDQYMYEMGKNLPAFQFIFDKYPNISEVVAGLSSREEVTRYFSNVSTVYDVGASWAYCTDAYVIAADVLEKVSGLTWEEYVQQHILTPLGLNDTYVEPTLLDGDQQRYAAYQANFGGQLVNLPVPVNKIGAPVGFIYSTAPDLAKYLTAHMSPENPILSSTGLAQMKQRMAKREQGLSYGLGWKIKDYRGMEVVEHAGGYPGVSSIATMIPQEQFGLVLLSNADSTPVQQMADSILNSIFHL